MRRLLVAIFLIPLTCGGQTNESTNQLITLQECIRRALLQNRDLQVERLNPEITRSALNSSYGYYDPLLFGGTRKEKATDSGGFDPADFSADAIYTAESTVGNAGLTGLLPSGMTYTMSANYANSSGSRNGLNFDSYKIGAGITVQQPLLKNLWIDQGRLIIRVNKRNLRISELGVAYLTMDIINQVQAAYYELLFARENVRVNELLLASRQQTLHGTRRRVEEGVATVSDEKVADAQVARVQTALIAASNAVVLAENALKTLLGDPFSDDSRAPLMPAESLLAVPETFSLMESWQRGVGQRPDLAQMKQEVEKADLDLKYRRNQLFPALDVVASYGRKGASTSQVFPPASAIASPEDAMEQLRDGEAPTESLGIVFSMPLSLQSERGNFRASKQVRTQALLRVKQKEELVLREISDALRTAELSLQRVGAARRARESAEAALAAEEQKLIGGKSTIFFVLLLQADLSSEQASEARAKADYNKAVSQLRFAEGSLLERNNIILDIR